MVNLAGVIPLDGNHWTIPTEWSSTNLSRWSTYTDFLECIFINFLWGHKKLVKIAGGQLTRVVNLAGCTVLYTQNNHNSSLELECGMNFSMCEFRISYKILLF